MCMLWSACAGSCCMSSCMHLAAVQPTASCTTYCQHPCQQLLCSQVRVCCTQQQLRTAVLPLLQVTQSLVDHLNTNLKAAIDKADDAEAEAVQVKQQVGTAGPERFPEPDACHDRWCTPFSCRHSSVSLALCRFVFCCAPAGCAAGKLPQISCHCALLYTTALCCAVMQLEKATASLTQLQSEHAEVTHVLIDAKVEIAEKKGEQGGACRAWGCVSRLFGGCWLAAGGLPSSTDAQSETTMWCIAKSALPAGAMFVLPHLPQRPWTHMVCMQAAGCHPRAPQHAACAQAGCMGCSVPALSALSQPVQVNC